MQACMGVSRVWNEAQRHAVLAGTQLVAHIPVRRGEPVYTTHPVLSHYMPAMTKLVDTMWEEAAPQSLDMSEAGLNYFRIYCLPTTAEEGVLLVWDLTGLCEYVGRMAQTLFEAYADTFFSVTGGRFKLVRPEEIYDEIGERVAQWGLTVTKPEEIAACRQLVMERIGPTGMERKSLLAITLGVSEAVTNALKYAGWCEFTLIQNPSGWTAMVSDEGRGIPPAIIPQALLMSGYSTEASLGLGFSAMMRCVDRLTVSSGSTGVTVLMHKSAVRN